MPTTTVKSWAQVEKLQPVVGQKVIVKNRGVIQSCFTWFKEYNWQSGRYHFVRVSPAFVQHGAKC